MLGIEPLLGRHIRAEEDAAGAARVVPLGFAVWQRRFAGDPSIVGQTVIIDARPHTVIGVMAAQVSVSRAGPALDGARSDPIRVQTAMGRRWPNT
jgi:putative ABC transport system permease protein